MSPRTASRLTVAVSAALLLAVLLACKGKKGSSSSGPTESASALSTTRKEYVGEWSAPGITLQIHDDGMLEYEKKTGGTSKKYSGKISEFKGDDIEVFALITVTLKVQNPPHLDGSSWKMTVEGDELTRKASGDEKRADHLEADIQKDLAAKGVIIKSIDCPPTRSESFDCTLHTGAGDLIHVHCSDDGKGNIDWKADVAVLDSDKIEGFIEDTYEKQLKKRVKATCPQGTLLKHAGDTFTCTAKPKTGGKADTVTVTVKNTAGDISIKS